MRLGRRSRAMPRGRSRQSYANCNSRNAASLTAVECDRPGRVRITIPSRQPRAQSAPGKVRRNGMAWRCAFMDFQATRVLGIAA